MIPRRTITLYPGILRDILSCLRSRPGRDRIAEFETAFASMCGTRHAVAVSSGTDAMLLILDGLGVAPGDHVLSTAYTIRPLVEVLRGRGYDLELVDVSTEDFNLDVDDLRRKIRPDTRAVIVTHMFGVPARFGAIREAVANPDCCLIEDAAHAHGATVDGRPCGSLGHAAFFSLDQVKPVSTFGGGVAATDDDAVAARMRESVASHPDPGLRLAKIAMGLIEQAVVFSPMFWFAAWLTRFENVREILGAMYRELDRRPETRNLRLSPLQAHIGLGQLRHLPGRIRSRGEIVGRITDRFRGLRPQRIPAGATASHHKFCALAPSDTPRVKEFLFRRGIDCGIRDDVNGPCHRELGLPDSDFPGTTEVYLRLLELPGYESLKPRQIDRIARALSEIE